MSSSHPWWRHAVVYQVYLRSFADGDGDGTGDIAGLRSRLSYIRSLGVDAIWINPWYVSPLNDGGYDVADYRRIDPRFGTLEDAIGLIEEANGLGLRVLLDLVPNHTSTDHVWFQEALASAPGGKARTRYHFRPGRGPDGAEPPTDWISVFGGRTWSRVGDGEWYLHLFDSTQPDLNWANPEVRAEFLDIIRFWLERGASGFRVDVANGLEKDPTYPDFGAVDKPKGSPVGTSTRTPIVIPSTRSFGSGGVSSTSIPKRSSSPRPGSRIGTGWLAISAPMSTTRRSISSSWRHRGRRRR